MYLCQVLPVYSTFVLGVASGHIFDNALKRSTASERSVCRPAHRLSPAYWRWALCIVAGFRCVHFRILYVPYGQQEIKPTRKGIAPTSARMGRNEGDHGSDQQRISGSGDGTSMLSDRRPQQSTVGARMSRMLSISACERVDVVYRIMSPVNTWTELSSKMQALWSMCTRRELA